MCAGGKAYHSNLFFVGDCTLVYVTECKCCLSASKRSRSKHVICVVCGVLEDAQHGRAGVVRVRACAVGLVCVCFCPARLVLDSPVT